MSSNESNQKRYGCHSGCRTASKPTCSAPAEKSEFPFNIDATSSGKHLSPSSSVIDAIAFTLLLDTARTSLELEVDRQAIESAKLSIRKQWGYGYPGMPELVIPDAIGRQVVQFSEIFPYWVAGVILFVDRAIAVQRRNGPPSRVSLYLHVSQWLYNRLWDAQHGINRLDEQALEPLLASIRSRDAAKAAAARHEETHKLKEEVFQYWRTNIDPAMSNEKAAELLRKQFPLSHRTLATYVASAKKRD